MRCDRIVSGLNVTVERRQFEGTMRGGSSDEGDDLDDRDRICVWKHFLDARVCLSVCVSVRGLFFLVGLRRGEAADAK